MKKIIIITIVILFCSCNRNKEIIKYDEQGNVESRSYIDSNKNFDSIVFYNKNLVIRKIIYPKEFKNNNSYYMCNYDKNEKLSSEGLVENNLKNGKWRFYDSNKLIKQVEFKIICNEEFPNQEYFYKENNTIDINKSNFFILLKKSIHSGQENEIKFKYFPLLKSKTQSLLFFSTKLKKDFCNLNEIKLDTVVPVKRDNQFDFNFKIGFRTKGNKNVRGYISEYYLQKVKRSDEYEYIEKRVYFDIPIVFN